MVLQFDPNKERLPIVVQRTEWKAKPPAGVIDKLDLPATFIFITYTGAVASCKTENECITTMQELQNFHMDHGQPDLPYNFLIGGDKKIYEGRGWFDSCPPPPDRPDLYKKSYVFAFIGPLRANYDVSMKDFKYAYQLVNYCVDNKYVSQDGWFYRHEPVDWNNYFIKAKT